MKKLTKKKKKVLPNNLTVCFLYIFLLFVKLSLNDNYTFY